MLLLDVIKRCVWTGWHNRRRIVWHKSRVATDHSHIQNIIGRDVLLRANRSLMAALLRMVFHFYTKPLLTKFRHVARRQSDVICSLLSCAKINSRHPVAFFVSTFIAVLYVSHYYSKFKKLIHVTNASNNQRLYFSCIFLSYAFFYFAFFYLFKIFTS